MQINISVTSSEVKRSRNLAENGNWKSHKFCNPNNSITEALIHAAFHKPASHQIQCITVKQCQHVPVSKKVLSN